MEDINNESVDSETSSTGSWVLVENSEEDVQLSSTDDIKNHSDNESDGISIISEGEFSHDGVSEDAYYEDKEITLTNEIEVFQGSEGENGEDEIESSEEIVENVLEPTVDTPASKMLIDASHDHDYQKFINWPSLMCTSVVIFAVLIFPYFSSKQQPNLDLDQYDANSLKNTQISDIDPYIYCKEIHKTPSNNDLHRDYTMRKCLKKVFKYIKKVKKSQIAREINFLDKEIDKETDKFRNTDKEIEINYRKMYKKRNDEEYTSQKYSKKFKFNDENEKIFQRNDEYNFENEKSGDRSRKNWNLAHEEISSKDSETGNNDDRKFVIINDGGKSQFFYHTKKNGENVEKSWRYQQKNSVDDLEKLRISLEKKEKSLREWENKLIEKEKRIGIEQEKLEKEKKRKGDFEETSKDKKYKKFVLLDEYPKDSKKNFNAHSNNENKNFFKIKNILKKNKTRHFDDDNITVTGEWYLNLLQNRQDTRRKEEKASWWFDRAEYRKNKRNKAYWYFQYMFNRENSRYRPKNM